MPEPDTRGSAGGGNALTKKIGPLQAWQWGALAAAGAGLVWFIRSRSSASSSTAADTTGTDTTGTDTTGDSGLLNPIVEQGQAGPEGPQGPQGKQGPPGAVKAPPKPTSGVGTRVSASDYPKQIYALTTRGKSLITLGTIKNGKITGKNVGKSGAPVYALVKTGFGPIWEQGFDPSKLPNGTKIGTLAQFKKDVQ